MTRSEAVATGSPCTRIDAHHDPYTLEPGVAYPCTDQGEQFFTLRLLAGPGLTARHGHALAGALTRPPVVTPHVTRHGTAPQQAGLLAVTARSSVVTWLKGAEDGHGLVLRLLEVEGRPGDGLEAPA